jgi:hypothetical protein
LDPSNAKARIRGDRIVGKTASGSLTDLQRRLRKDCSMKQATGNASRRAVGRVLASAALLFAAAIIQPEVANAADGDGGGGGGFHGGGFHGFHGFHGGGFHHAFGHFRAGFGFGGIYAPYWWGYGYPYYNDWYSDNYPEYGYYRYDPGNYYGNYPDYDYGSQPNARKTWYYCPAPAGYYPYVTHCNTVWQYGPVSAINRDSAAPTHGSRD